MLQIQNAQTDPISPLLLINIILKKVNITLKITSTKITVLILALDKKTKPIICVAVLKKTPTKKNRNNDSAAKNSLLSNTKIIYFLKKKNH